MDNNETMHALKHRFRGIRALYGDNNFQNFLNSHVCIYGCGGVGSWAIEALARTAIGQLTIIDDDVVEESNVNRQNPALESNMGKYKAIMLANRLLEINPYIKVNAITKRLTVENFKEILPQANVYIDAIDDLEVKAAILNYAYYSKIKIISAGGSGGKTDPSLVHQCDLAYATHDRLLKRLRDTLRKEYNMKISTQRKIGIPVVSCAEQVKMSDKTQDDVPAFGAGMCVTATVGLGLAAWVIEKLRE